MNFRLGFSAFLVLASAFGVSAKGPVPGSPAPDFKLPNLIKKDAVTLHSLEGKVVLVDFWASWCQPCRKTLPQIGKLRARHPGMAALAVTLDEDRAKALDFLKPKIDGLIFLHDPKHSVAEAYDLAGMPSLLLIDRKGVLRARYDGYTESDMKNIEEQVARLEEEK